MCQICADKKSLTKDVLRSLTQALIYCRLDYCNGQNNRHSDKTAAIGTEYRSLFSVWSTTSEPHHSSPTQPPLTSGAAECCQLYGNVSTALLIHIFRNSALSWKTLSSFTVCISWMQPTGKSADINQSAEYHIIWSTVWNGLPSVPRDYNSLSSGSGRTVICLDNAQYHPICLWHFWHCLQRSTYLGCWIWIWSA